MCLRRLRWSERILLGTKGALFFPKAALRPSFGPPEMALCWPEMALCWPEMALCWPEQDIARYCRRRSTLTQPLTPQVLECLREHANELSPSCSSMLFRRQEQSLILPKADYFLSTACKGMILKHCPAPELRTGADVLDCLKVGGAGREGGRVGPWGFVWLRIG